MKKAKLIPIEVLRVEDKICGSLNFTQVGLLVIPLAAAVVLLFFPPAGKLPLYKLACIVLTFAISGLLAVRVNERLVLNWLRLIMRYNARPQSYVSAVKTKAVVVTPPPGALLPDVKKFVPAKPSRPLVPIKEVSFRPKVRVGREKGWRES